MFHLAAKSGDQPGYFVTCVRILGNNDHSIVICLNVEDLFLRLTNGEKPPSIVLVSFARLPIEIDFHCAVGGGGDFEPVLANI